MALVAPKRIPVRREYLSRGAPQLYGRIGGETRPEPVEARLHFTNPGGVGTGEPLPRGIVRIYKRDTAGEVRFVGEDRIGHSPVGGPVRLVLGRAFDVTVERLQTAFTRKGPPQNDYEAAYTLTLANAGPEPVAVKVLEPLSGDWLIVEESAPHRREGNAATWSIHVPAAGAATLSYRVRVKR